MILDVLIPLAVGTCLVVGVWAIFGVLGTSAVAMARWLLPTRERGGIWQSWALAQPFAFAALIIGFMAGNSRTSVLGTLLPAVLTLIGGMVALVWAKDRKAKLGVVVTVPSVAAALFLGATVGSHIRERVLANEESQRYSDEAMASVRARWQHQVEEEMTLQRYRRALGLNEADAATVRNLLRPPGSDAPKAKE